MGSRRLSDPLGTVIVKPWEIHKNRQVNVDLTEGWAGNKGFLAPLEQANVGYMFQSISFQHRPGNFPIFLEIRQFLWAAFLGSLTNKSNKAVHWP